MPLRVCVCVRARALCSPEESQSPEVAGVLCVWHPFYQAAVGATQALPSTERLEHLLTAASVAFLPSSSSSIPVRAGLCSVSVLSSIAVWMKGAPCGRVAM